MRPDEPHLSPAELSDLSALADGTLDPGHQEEVREWISSSPQLRQIYQRESTAVAVLHELRASDRAPQRLRSQIERRQATRRVPAHGNGRRFALAIAVPVAAAVAILALALPSGTPGAPSVSEAAALAQRGPEQGPPAPNPRHPRTRLDQAVQDVYFPNWATTLGWRAVGQRQDRVGAQRAVTVYYARRGRRLAYTIVGGRALSVPHGASKLLNGFQLSTLRLRGRTIVTWRRDGHTCVISASGVPLAAVQQLAVWRSSGISR